MTDGKAVIPLASSQDHKARDEGDRGPNTGGMGAYSPAPVITPAIEAHILRDIIKPTISGMRASGTPYVGFLYAGLMIDKHGRAKVLEFNCRLGDPETQAILMRLNSDIVALCQLGTTGHLHKAKPTWDPRLALTVVLTAGGYPGQYQQGDTILGLEAVSPHCKIFHSGTALEGQQLVTQGGRVLAVTALGTSIQRARDRIYPQINHIHWPNMYYRKDIGHRALAREQALRESA